METKIATIKRGDENAHLVLSGLEETVEIILTDDNPNEVKIAFNILLQQLKKGPFQFTLDDSGEDLYNQICKEYLKQLNSELVTVYGELKEYSLVVE